jgi:hypothetical protein
MFPIMCYLLKHNVLSNGSVSYVKKKQKRKFIYVMDPRA